MAKPGEGPHPNVLKATASPQARYLNANKQAARARRARIVELKTQGVKVSEIAERFGISAVRVYQLLQKAAALQRAKRQAESLGARR